MRRLYGWHTGLRPADGLLGVWAGRERLTVWRRWSRPRRLTWDALAVARPSDLVASVEGWDELLAESRLRKPPAAPARAPALAAAQIEACFGLQPGAQVACLSGTYGWPCLAWLAPSMLLAYLVALPLTGGRWQQVWFLSTNVPFTFAVLQGALWLSRRVTGWRVSARGLALRERGWVYLAWDEILELRPLSRHALLVRTRQGEFRVPPGVGQLEVLRAGLERLLALRAAGAVLPRLREDVPEGALSRAERSADDDRGLSPGLPPGA